MIFAANPDDGPFIGADVVREKLVKFIVSVTIGDAVLDVERFFTITVVPGYPAVLKIIDPSDNQTICVPNGESLPDIVAACFDENGNRTAPSARSVRWKVLLAPQGPLSGARSFPVLADGTALLSPLTVEVDNIGGGAVVSHEVSLQWDPPPGIMLSQQQLPPRALITLNVTPGQKPEQIEVSRQTNLNRI